MTLAPLSLRELTAALADAHARGERIDGHDLTALSRVLEYTPEDMTVTVEAGLTVAALQTQLSRARQWLPLDPPHPERLSIGALIATNASGPRRFGYGTIREHLLGIRVALADGRLIKAGGKVVKNVAGYDLCKLFVGSRGTLGVIVEATFKVRPLPEAEQFVQATCDTWASAEAMVEACVESELTPVAIDLHNLPPSTEPAAADARPRAINLVWGFAGPREDVEWQLARARELGVSSPANLDYDKSFWDDASGGSSRQFSVLPSRVIETLRGLGDVRFVARAGNGIIYYRGGPEPPKHDLPRQLMRRVRDAYDPKHILPELTM